MQRIETRIGIGGYWRWGYAIQRHLHAVVSASPVGLAVPVAQEGGDTIFAIDRHVEPIIEREVEQWSDDCKPLVLIAEGMGPDGRRVCGSAKEVPRYRLIVDPIDGTRNLMYDKRSAWFIAAIAENHGDLTGLKDTFASVIVELPTTKQTWCDAYVGTRERPTIGIRSTVGGGNPQALPPRPSRASTLEHGFGQVSNFFPGTKVLAAQLLERIAAEAIGAVEPGRAMLFDDQYISSGGQMVELMAGHDRFCCDLRPLFHRILARDSCCSVRGLECHPYDVAGALAAQQAGVVITDGFGNPLDCPLDVNTGVHWCGFANQRLAGQIQPIINAWLSEHAILPDGCRDDRQRHSQSSSHRSFRAVPRLPVTVQRRL